MELCLYCGKNEGATKDHVPPQGLFPDPKPTTLLTVPSCLPCNQGYMLDDEYFRIAMTSESAYRDANATAVWKTKVLPRLKKDPPIVRPNRHPLREKIAKNMVKANVITKAGIKTGEVLMMPFEIARVERVVKRIVQGLLWGLYKRRLSSGTPMEVFIRPKIDGMEDILYRLEARSIGEIFKYRHGLTVDGSDNSLWWLQFYGVRILLSWSAAPLMSR